MKIAKTCRHCQRVFSYASKGRGLCSVCHNSLEIRGLYKPKRDTAGNRQADPTAGMTEEELDAFVESRRATMPQGEGCLTRTLDRRTV